MNRPKCTHLQKKKLPLKLFYNHITVPLKDRDKTGINDFGLSSKVMENYLRNCIFYTTEDKYWLENVIGTITYKAF